MYLVRAHILIVLVLKLLSFGAGTPDGQNACSCYTFENDRTMNWQQAKRSCEYNKKHLVVMETEREWEFIYKEINQTTAGKFNEWHIGLFLNSTTGDWTWINGKPLTINKWQPKRPNNDQDSKSVYALIAKEYPPGYYGLFNSIRSIITRAWICEEETDNCSQGVCMPHDPVTTAKAHLPSTTTATTAEKTQSQTDLQAGIKTVARTAELRGHKDDKRYFTEFIIAASLAAFLFITLIAFAAFAVVFFLKRKKRRQDARASISVGNPPEDHNGPLLNPENAATQLGLSEMEDGIGSNERENPQRATPSNLECEYTMLNPLTMTQGEKFYTSLTEGEQGISASGAGDESPTYINQMPKPEYMNV